MTILAWVVIMIKNKYTLWGRKRFLLPVTCFSPEYNLTFYSTSNGYNKQKKHKLRQSHTYGADV